MQIHVSTLLLQVFSDEWATAKERSKRLKANDIDFEKQCLYNFPATNFVGSKSYSVHDLNLYLFADEVDLSMINWERIVHSPELANNLFWISMNSETFMENKTIVPKCEGFREVTLKHVLRNTTMNAKFVNEVRKIIMSNRAKEFQTPEMGHCVDGMVPKIYFMETAENPSKSYSTGTYSWFDKYGHFLQLPLSPLKFILYEKLPNIVVSSIIEMFGTIDTTTFHRMVLAMKEELCIISNETILKYLEKCFDIMDKRQTYKEKIRLMTPHAVIGREFDNVLYINPSYIFTVNNKSNDVVHSNFIIACSRPKNQLVIIDVGGNLRHKNLRCNVLTSLLKKELLLPLKCCLTEAIDYLQKQKQGNVGNYQKPLQQKDVKFLVKAFKNSRLQENKRHQGFNNPYLPKLQIPSPRGNI